MDGDTSTLVIVRKDSDLEWASAIPEHVKIVIYNSGKNVQNLDLLQRARIVPASPASSGTARSYLSHLLTLDSRSNTWTIFASDLTMGENPDLSGLFSSQDQWDPVQPLPFASRPPTPALPSGIAGQNSANGAANRVLRRKEHFSLFSLNTTKRLDHHCHSLVDRYSKIYGIGRDVNLASHFLELVGLDKLADQAAKARLGSYVPGSMFAVHASRLSCLPASAIHKILQLLDEQEELYAGLLERLWLHLFGERFIDLRPVPAPAEGNVPAS